MPENTTALPEVKDIIQFDDFAKLDLRVATIVEATRMEKSDKLLRLLVDTGHERRTVLSGIAKHFSPEELLGKQVTLVVNLAPRKMMGVESQGMILMADDGAGNLRLLQPSAAVPPGSPVS